MDKLNQLKSQIETVKQSAQNEVEKIHLQASEHFKTLMETEPIKSQIDKMVKDVESSNKLTESRNDEFYYQWVRVDLSPIIDTKDVFQKELFENYMQDYHFVTIDFENDCLMYCIGPCIIIDNDGDVLDQNTNKWFISRKAYSSTDERNSLIEAHMEKTGCYPSVVKCNNYGNVYYYNIHEK